MTKLIVHLLNFMNAPNLTDIVFKTCKTIDLLHWFEGCSDVATCHVRRAHHRISVKLCRWLLNSTLQISGKEPRPLTF